MVTPAERLNTLRNKQRLAELRAKSTEPAPAIEPETEFIPDITREELNQISKESGIPVSNLEKATYGLGGEVRGRPMGLEEAAWAAAGFLGESIALGLPQAAFIETREDDKTTKGYDRLRQMIKQRQSLGRTAAEVGAGLLVPGIGLARAGKAAATLPRIAGTGAAIGGVESAATAPTEERLRAGAIGAAAGAGLGAAGLALTKTGKAIGKKVSEKIAKGIEERAEKIGALDLDEQINKKIADNKPLKVVLESDDAIDKASLERFAKYEGKPVEDIIADPNKKFLGEQYQRFIKTEAAQEVIEEQGLKGKLLPLNRFQKAIFKFSDNKPLFKIFDKRLGTNLEQTLDDMSARHAKYTQALAESLKRLEPIRKATERAGIKNIDLYRALDTNNRARVVPEDLFKQWKKWFSDEADFINTGDWDTVIQKIDNYVPKKRLSAIKYVRAIEDWADDLNKTLKIKPGRITAEDFNKLKQSPDGKQFIGELEFSTGKPIKTAADVNTAYRDVIHDIGSVQEKLAKEASASKQRLGQIPDRVLDKDVTNLAARWLQDTYQSGAVRSGISEMRRVADTAKKLDEDFISNHLEKLIADLTGTRTDTIGAGVRKAGQQLQLAAQRNADKATNRFSKAAWEGAANSPLFINMLMRQIYPNYLGLNPKSAIQNLTSPILGIVPDMGVGYGSTKALQSLADFKKIIADGINIKLSPNMARKLNKPAGTVIKTRSPNLVLQNEGLLPEQWTGEMVDALQEGIKSGAVTDMTKKGLEKSTKALMFLFEKSEIAARFQAYSMGKNIARDLIRDKDFGKKFISRVDSPSYQKSLKKAIDNDNLEEAENIMTRFLNSNNMFNYDRANMSAYGRFFGPLFSVFSKWPTSIAGRIMTDFYNRGAIPGGIRTGRTLVAPFAALAFIDNVADLKDSDIEKKIFGAKGLKGWTPFDSAIGVAQGEGLLKAPALETFETVGKALFDDRDGSLRRAVGKGLNTYMPGAGWVRFFQDDTPIYLKASQGKFPLSKPEAKGMEKILKQVTGE